MEAESSGREAERPASPEAPKDESSGREAERPASPEAPKENVATCKAPDRGKLKRKLFRILDVDKDRRLDVEEMLQLALATGFDGDDDAWVDEYIIRCKDHGVKDDHGFSKNKILKLLDDETDRGLYLETEQIDEIVKAHGDSAAADPDDDLHFDVDVVRDSSNSPGFEIRKPDMAVVGLTRAVGDLRKYDILTAVNGQPTPDFAAYSALAHGVDRFSLRVLRPKEFIEADRWVKRRPGYAFRLGEHGLGYYRDRVFGVCTPICEEEKVVDFWPCRVFRGRVIGFAFRRGSKGVGYYADRLGRRRLKESLVSLWDCDRDGYLNKAEMCQCSRDMGFDGTYEEYCTWYDDECAKKGLQPARGFPTLVMLDVLEDKTENGMYLTVAEMEKLKESLVAALRPKPAANGKESGCTLEDLPISRLKELAGEHSISLVGCVEKSDIVAILRARSVPDPEPVPVKTEPKAAVVPATAAKLVPKKAHTVSTAKCARCDSFLFKGALFCTECGMEIAVD